MNRRAPAGLLAAALLLLGPQGCTGVTQSGEKEAAPKEPVTEAPKPTYAPPPPDHRPPPPEPKPQPDVKPEPPPPPEPPEPRLPPPVT